MTLHLKLLRWLSRRYAVRQPQASRSQMKKRQWLPTLPARRNDSVRFQDDDSPPGHRIHWRL